MDKVEIQNLFACNFLCIERLWIRVIKTLQPDPELDQNYFNSDLQHYK